MENTEEIIRVYSVEEYEKYFNEKKYVSLEELVEINNAIFNATGKRKYEKL